MPGFAPLPDPPDAARARSGLRAVVPHAGLSRHMPHPGAPHLTVRPDASLPPYSASGRESLTLHCVRTRAAMEKIAMEKTRNYKQGLAVHIYVLVFHIFQAESLLFSIHHASIAKHTTLLIS